MRSLMWQESEKIPGAVGILRQNSRNRRRNDAGSFKWVDVWESFGVANSLENLTKSPNDSPKPEGSAQIACGLA